MMVKGYPKVLVGLLGLLGLLAIYSPLASAAGPPIVSANEFTEVKLNVRNLVGTIDPNGSSTSYTVEYGRTKLYGQVTPSKSVSGTGPIPITVPLVGLQPMSTYHYRISATNGSGKTLTEDTLFETLLSWKVGGKRLSELELAASFEDQYKGGPTEGGSVEFKGYLLGSTVRVYCKQSAAINGILDVQYGELAFKNGCFTQVNGVISPLCAPKSGVTLYLNGLLAQTKSSVVALDAECPIGENLGFKNGGYSPDITPEATSYSSILEGVTYMAGKPWETTINPVRSGPPGGWKLSGAYLGSVFGVS
jgi:hypothetical protein